MLTDFLGGKLPLFKSFWFVAVPSGIFINFILYFYKLQPGSVETIWALILISLISLAIVVGVWNSTTNYDGSIFWKYLSRFWCITCLVLIVLPILYGVLDRGTTGLGAIYDNHTTGKVDKSNEAKSSVGGTYDYYRRVDEKNCDSTFNDKPSYSLEFIFKKITTEVFIKATWREGGEKKQRLIKLDNCTVLDSKNWTCGGEWTTTMTTPTYTFINNVLTFDEQTLLGFKNCGKLVER
jgi:hypothetical protein